MGVDRKRLRRTALLLGVVILAPQVQAQEPVLRSMARAAAVVVEGTVQSIAFGRDTTGVVYTYTRIELAEVWKGGHLGTEVVIKQPGGRIGDTLQVFSSSSDHIVGDQVVLFLGPLPRDGALSPLGSAGVGYIGWPPGGERSVVFPANGAGSRIGHDALRREVRRVAVAAPAAATRPFVSVPIESPAALWSRELPVARLAASILSAVKWKRADGYRYMEQSLVRDRVTFGRWYPVAEELEVINDSQTNQYPNNEDNIAIDRAITSWVPGGRASLMGRLRMKRGRARSVFCSPPWVDHDGTQGDGDRAIGVKYKNDCGFMPDGDPSFALAGFEADLSQQDVVRAKSRYHGKELTFARITSSVIHMNRGEQKHTTANGDSLAVNDLWSGAGTNNGLQCFTQILRHMMGHAFGIGHSVLKGFDTDTETTTRKGRNLMDVSLHALNTDPPFLPKCFQRTDRLTTGSADRRALARMLRKPLS